MDEKFLLIYYFDQVIGPALLYSGTAIPEDPDFPDMTRVLEFNDKEGTFIFSFRKYQSINHSFYLVSNLARGGQELIMISFLIQSSYYRNELVDVFKYLELKGPILENFARELQDLKDFHKILHQHKRNISAEEFKKFCEMYGINFLALYQKYFIELFPEFELRIITKDIRIPRKIYIMGPKKSGKSTLLKHIEAIQFKRQENFNMATRIFTVVIDNILIPSLAESIENGLELEKTQGIIYIFSTVDDGVKNDIKSLIKSLNEYKIDDPFNKLPLIVIHNHFNEVSTPEELEFNIEEILSELKHPNIPKKFFSINLLEERDELFEILRWLVKNII